MGLVEGPMKRCDCCEAAIADSSVRLICPPCAQSLIVPTHNTSQVVCKLHGRQVALGDWDNEPAPLRSA